MSDAARDRLYLAVARQLGVSLSDAVWEAGEGGWDSVRRAAVEAGDLDDSTARVVEALVAEALALHGGDPRATLGALPETLRRDVSGTSATLQRSTSGESVAALENVSVEARGRYQPVLDGDGQPVELGRGGVGRVVVVRDRLLEREVARKELLRDITTSAQYETQHIDGLEARFLREARVTGQLEHPAVVPVYELARAADGTLYFTMLRVEGRTLAQAIADAKGLDARLALLPAILTVCRAIAAAHHRGVIHRDLKPQNVMLGADGETYVMDWGLARVLARGDSDERSIALAPDLTLRTDAAPIGTPSYMSPEQAWGERERIDEKSDVWGLGALLYELLTGRAPFVGDSPWHVLLEVRSRPPPRVLSLAPDVPPELAAICSRALRRNRDERYASAEAMAKDLEAWLSGSRVSAYDYTARQVLGRLARRHRPLLVVASVALLALVGVVGVTVWRVRQERDDARAMAALFLQDVRSELARAAWSDDALEQLSRSALDVYAASVDLETGPRADRLLLADVWLDLGAIHRRAGRGAQAAEAVAEADRVLRPLERQWPDDVEVLERRLRQRVREGDLRLDARDESGALSTWLGLRGLASRVAAAQPQTAERLAGPQLLESKLAVLLGAQRRFDEAFAAGRRAVALGEVRLALAPGDPTVLSDVADDLRTLGQLHAARGEREAAVGAWARAVQLLADARGRRDSLRLRRTHLSTLRRLAAGTAPPRRAVLLAEARQLGEDLAAVMPSDAGVLGDLAAVAVLQGDLDRAWLVAQRLDALGGSPELVLAVVELAFACGHDERVLSRLGGATGSMYAPVQAVVSFSWAMAGRLPEAAEAARAAKRGRGASQLSWYVDAWRERARVGRGAGARVLEGLFSHVDVYAPSDESVEAAFDRYVERLESGAGE